MSWKVGFDRTAHATLSPNVEKTNGKDPVHIMTLRARTPPNAKIKGKQRKKKTKQPIIEKVEEDEILGEIIDLNKADAIDWTDKKAHDFFSSQPNKIPELYSVDEILIRKYAGPLYVCTFLNERKQECRARLGGALVRSFYRNKIEEEQTNLLKRI